MTPKDQLVRRAKDAFLILLWVFGYQAVVRTFAGLQRIEVFLARSMRRMTRANRRI